MSSTEAGTSRWNISSTAHVYTDKIFSDGSFKNVYRAKYTEGQRAGEACVAKEMKSGSTWMASVFDNELKVVSRAVDIIEQFNNARVISRRILMNRPSVWQYDQHYPEWRAQGIAGASVLVEPLIENFEKFNSNSGWAATHRVDELGWTQVMQVCCVRCTVLPEMQQASLVANRVGSLLCEYRHAVH